MRSVVLALMLLLAGASGAVAGAWLRAEGTGFASSTVSVDGEREVSTTAYLEYGLSERLTLGADLYYGSDLTTFQEGSGIVFLRFPLAPLDATHKFAAHVGLGTRYTEMRFRNAAEIGLSWGRGIAWRDRYGWINVDASLNEAQSPAARRVKLDGTVGMALTERSKVMLQLFNTNENDETYTRIAPSWLFAPGGGKTTLQVGVEAPVSGGGNTTLKLGVWIDF